MSEGADRATLAGHEFARQLLRQAAIEGIHPQIFLARVVGAVIGMTQVTAGADAAAGMCRTLIGMADDILPEIQNARG